MSLLGNKFILMTSHTPHNKKKADWENRPRRFGKSTFVTDAFLAEAKAGNSVVYHHPDYICLTNEAYKNAIRQERQRLLDEVLEVVGEDESLEPFTEWYKATRPYGGTRGEYSKLEDIINNQNQLRAQLREKLQALR